LSNIQNKKMKTFIFKTKLLSDKKIAREIEVLENTNLYKLAGAIVDAYDFDFDHCFGFFSKITDGLCFDSERKYELLTDIPDVEQTGAGSVEKTKIGEVWRAVGDKMLFLFDYGDDWRFVVELAGLGERRLKTKYSRLLKRVGIAPPQYEEVGKEENM